MAQQEREKAMLMAAKMLANYPIDKLNQEDVNTIFVHGNIIGAFICGARWEARNPESPWVNISEQMPEDSVPTLSNKDLGRHTVKVMVRMKNNNWIMETRRRVFPNGQWNWDLPSRMRDQITHWMPIPPIPATVD